MVPWSGYFEDAISSSTSPFMTFSGQRGFRSGDVGRWAAAQNGGETLQILGRRDQMVKAPGGFPEGMAGDVGETIKRGVPKNGWLI